MGVLAGYLRVSHVGGRGGDSFHSPQEQTEEIEVWAKRHKHRVVCLPPELDAKGSDASRPTLRRAVEGVKAGTYEGVVVAYLSRAGRDLRLMLDLWDEVEGAGGRVYFARENIDASTPSGRLQRNLLASIAQHELEERREGFERARRGAVERGIWQRRQTPRGYSRDTDTRRLVVNEQAEDVQGAARDLLGGATVSQLGRQLGMTASGVRQMLRNRVYLGELTVGKHTNEKAHPAILDLATFEAVQAKLDANFRPPRSTQPIALLAGLVRCASCGHVMTRGNSKGAATYSCPTRHSGSRCPGPASIACRRLDPHVEEIALSELRRLSIRADADYGLEEARRELADGRAELAAYLEAVDAAGIGSPDAAAGMRSRRERVEAAEEVLRRETARLPALPVIEGGAEIWPQLDPHERNDLLRCLLAAVAVKRVGSGARVAVGDRARVIRYGADVRLPARTGNGAGGIAPLWPDGDGVDVIPPPVVEDSLEAPGGA